MGHYLRDYDVRCGSFASFPRCPNYVRLCSKTGDKATDATAGDASEDKGATPARSGMQGKRGRGTVFLVNRRTHDVLWSVYELPKDNRPVTLRRSAGRISNQLAKAIKGK